MRFNPAVNLSPTARSPSAPLRLSAKQKAVSVKTHGYSFYPFKETTIERDTHGLIMNIANS